MAMRKRTILYLMQCMGLILLLVLYGWPNFAAGAELRLAPVFAEFAEQQGIAAFTGTAVSPLLYEQHSQLLVQYTSTHRFELVDGKVRLAALGRELTHHRQHEAPFQWQDKNSLELDETAIFIEESGHSLAEPFRSYWEQHGQMAVFGWPISEAFVEHNAIEGIPMLVQYFERGRLVTNVPPALDPEHAESAKAPPEQENEPDEESRIESGIGGAGLNQVGDGPAAPASITVAPLGRQHLQNIRNFNEQAFLELPSPGSGSGDTSALATTTWFYNPASNDGRNMARALELLDGTIIDGGRRLSTLNAIGPLTEENGYLPGSAIENGVIVGDSIAGGVCAVSTMLYRAAWIAGLPVPVRSGHSLFLNQFHDGGWLGIEAAIDSRGPDLIIGNDTPGPLLIRTEADPARHRLQLTIYGLPDGRVVKRMDPEPSAALVDIMRDRGMLSVAGESEEVSVTNSRLIIYPDGRTNNDRVKTFYRMP